MDKPTGPTSHDVVAAVRRAYGIKRVGHTGTLDPFASGLLPVLVGNGTRLARFLAALPKTYTGVLRLGRTTDTLDATGTTLVTHDGALDVSADDLNRAFQTFSGVIEQIPPDYSAKKVDGIPAHRRMRRGESVTLEPVTVTVHRIEITDYSAPDVAFEVAVSSGTYIRALARDIGALLGVGAHLTELRRTVVGGFSVADAVGMDQLTGAELRPLAEAVKHLPQVSIDRTLLADVLHGRRVAAGDREADGEAAVALTCDGDLVAVAESLGESLQPRVVLAE